MLAGIALALVVTAVGLACGGAADEAAAPPETPTQPSPVGSGREAAPPLEGISLEGEPIAVGDLRGRLVLMNVWSSW